MVFEKGMNYEGIATYNNYCLEDVLTKVATCLPLWNT